MHMTGINKDGGEMRERLQIHGWLYAMTNWPLMGMFNTVYNLVVTRNMWAHFIESNLIVFKFSQTNIKKLQKLYGFQISSFSGCWLLISFVIFHSVKVVKHICYPSCHLVAENGSWVILIGADINFNANWKRRLGCKELKEVPIKYRFDQCL
jgi:hypothetical protein